MTKAFAVENKKQWASAAGEGDAGADFDDGLVDKAEAALAMTALVRRRRGQFATGR